MNHNWFDQLVEDLGDFNLIRVEAILSCKIRTESSDGGSNKTVIEFLLLYNCKEIILEFNDVQKARFPELGAFGLQFGDPFIDSINSGFEKINYRLSDEIEDWIIECNDIVAYVKKNSVE